MTLPAPLQQGVGQAAGIYLTCSIRPTISVPIMSSHSVSPRSQKLMTTNTTVMANQQLRLSVVEPCKESVDDSPALLLTGFIIDTDSCQSAMLCVVVVNVSVLFYVTSILYAVDFNETEWGTIVAGHQLYMQW